MGVKARHALKSIPEKQEAHQLDEEWVELMKIARKLGFSVDRVRSFLREREQVYINMPPNHNNVNNLPR